MKSRNLFLWMALVIGLMIMAPGAMAQCVPNVPTQINLHESYCLQVCPWDEYVFWLWCPYEGEQNFPHIILTPGCAHGGAACNDPTCPPVPVPGWPWAPGVPPVFDPNGQIHVLNDCMEIFVYWNHDGFWVIEILMNDCAGCFCLWFDWQLPVELRSFSSVAGNSEVALHWVTGTETNFDKFQLLRDGVLKAEIPSQGNGSEGHSYTWSDTQVENGTTYEYTLNAVDLNSVTNTLGTQTATPMFTSAGTITDYALAQNYPNPFNPTTQIVFDMPESRHVTLKVYNPMGAVVATLVNGNVGSGRHTVNFDGSNYTSGLYFYTLSAGDVFTATRKMLLVK